MPVWRAAWLGQAKRSRMLRLLCVAARGASRSILHAALNNGRGGAGGDSTHADATDLRSGGWASNAPQAVCGCWLRAANTGCAAPAPPTGHDDTACLQPPQHGGRWWPRRRRQCATRPRCACSATMAACRRPVAQAQQHLWTVSARGRVGPAAQTVRQRCRVLAEARSYQAAVASWRWRADSSGCGGISSVLLELPGCFGAIHAWRA